jgi:hypothetical protein
MLIAVFRTARKKRNLAQTDVAIAVGDPTAVRVQI